MNQVNKKNLQNKQFVFLPRGDHESPSLKPRYREKYLEIRGDLQKKCDIKNVMQIPRLEKIVLTSCQGRATQNSRLLDLAVDDLERITGQKPVVIKAKRSVSAFKLREGAKMAAMVTLRQDRMYEFYDRLITLVLPRVRDFRGLSNKSFDGNGNYSLGIRDQLVFPEVEFDRTQETRGLGITLVTTTDRDDWAREFLALMGFPFRKDRR